MSSVRDIFKPYQDKLSVSKPIFKISLVDGEIRATLDESAKFIPPATEGDAIARLVYGSFEERFDKQSRRFWVSSVDTDKYLYTIRTQIIQFILKNAPFKNPRQSKIYRFFKYSNISDFNETQHLFFVHLYKYMYKHVDPDMAILNKTSPHLSNILSILEAFEEKYGKDQEKISKRRYR
jgi:hypothetical protein